MKNLCNGRTHTAVPVGNYLKTVGWDILHPPDITSSDHHLFRSITNGLFEEPFHSYEENMSILLKRRVVFPKRNSYAAIQRGKSSG